MTVDPDPGKGREERKREGLRTTMGHLHLGTQLALALLLGLLGGDWLDDRTGWSPVFTLTGAVLGIAAGMGVVIREVAGKKR